MGRSQRAAIESRLEILIAHLLKLLVQPERAAPGWSRTVKEQRREIARLIARTPSLRRLPVQVLGDAYRAAIRLAGRDTFLDEARFPPANPFTLDRIIDLDSKP